MCSRLRLVCIFTSLRYLYQPATLIAKTYNQDISKSGLFATNPQSRQMCCTDKYSFASRHVPRQKFVQGFQTGDIVKAVVPLDKKTGNYMGRVAVRSTERNILYYCSYLAHR